MARLPFSRKKSDVGVEQTQEELPVVEQEQPKSNLPKEVQDYYESGSRERRGMAWLLGLGTLLVTLLLAAGIFFGGRWIYNKIANNNDQPQDTAQIGEDQKKEESNQNNQNSGSNSSDSNSNQNQPQPTPAPTPTPTPAPTPTPQPTPTPVPAPQTQDSKSVPNTGPGDVVAIAVATTVVSMAGFYVVQLKKES